MFELLLQSHCQTAMVAVSKKIISLKLKSMSE